MTRRSFVNTISYFNENTGYLTSEASRTVGDTSPNAGVSAKFKLAKYFSTYKQGGYAKKGTSYLELDDDGRINGIEVRFLYAHPTISFGLNFKWYGLTVKSEGGSSYSQPASGTCYF